MSKPTQEMALPCPFDCDGTAQYFEDDYNHGYLCDKCEGCFMPCLKPLRIQSGPAMPVDVKHFEPGTDGFKNNLMRDWCKEFFVTVKGGEIVSYHSADCNKIVEHHTCEGYLQESAE